MRCPSCGKGGFADHESVARHMSQPRSGCANWTDNLVRLHENLTPSVDHDSMSIDEPSIVQGLHELGQNELPEDAEDAPALEELPERRSSSTHYFPGAAQVYEGGTTFLDKFEADEFNKHRLLNVYYPFGSSGDWELASWLLRSGLSMGAIDSLLSLNLVRLFVLVFQIHEFTLGVDEKFTYLISNCKGAAKTC